MRSHKEQFLDYMMDFIIKNLPLSKLFNYDEELEIGGVKYSLKEILSYSVYHPIDIFLINPENASNKNSYAQFLNNLYINYSSPEMDFTIKDSWCLNKKGQMSNYIPELSFFPPNTADFIKYRLEHNEIESGLRGGRTDIINSGRINGKFVLNYRDQISPYITDLMYNYLFLCNDEDQYDFFVLYFPFINYFCRIDESKPIFFSIVEMRHKEIMKLHNYDENAFIHYPIDNSKNKKLYDAKQLDSKEDEYKYIKLFPIYNQIFNLIMMYNVINLSNNEFLDVIIDGSYNTLTNFYYDFIGRNHENLKRLYSLKGLYYINNFTKRNYSKSEELLCILSVLLYISNRVERRMDNNNDFTLTNKIFSIIESVSKSDYPEDTLITELEILQLQPVHLHVELEPINADITISIIDNDNSIDNILYIFQKVAGSNKIGNAKKAAENQVTTIQTAYNILNNFISSIYTKYIQNKEFNDIVIEDILFLNNNSRFNISANTFFGYKSYVSTFITKINQIDVRKHLTLNLEKINNSLKDINESFIISNVNEIVNYKDFISLLPTIYLKTFYSIPSIGIQTIGTQTNAPVGHKPFSLSFPRVNYGNNPVNINTQTGNQSILIPNRNAWKENITYDIFWRGIPIKDFDNFPLYIKNIILDSCLVLALINNSSECITYQEALHSNEDIERICLLPIPYNTSETLYDIFERVSKKLKDNIVESQNVKYNYYKSDNIGLSKNGNKEFLLNIGKCEDIGDLIKLYIMISKDKEGSDNLNLPKKQELYFVITLLELLGYHPRLMRRNVKGNNYNYIITDTSVNPRSLLNLLNRNYKITQKRPEIANTIVKCVLPLINYLNSRITNNKYDVNASAGSNDNYAIILKNNPLDTITKLDFPDSNNMFELMNIDPFDIDNQIFKKMVSNHVKSMHNDNFDISDIIVNNIPETIYIKADIYDQVYNKTLGGASINEILGSLIEGDECNSILGPDEDEIDSEKTKDMIKKLVKLLKRSSNLNIEENANIVKTNILSSIDNTFQTYACPERLPTRYLAHIKHLLAQFEQNKIEISPEVKEDLKNIIHNIYYNTTKLIKLIAILSSGIEIVKAYKRLNRDTSGNIVDNEFINKICSICRDALSNYIKRVEMVYKNSVRMVFGDQNLDNLEFDIEF